MTPAARRVLSLMAAGHSLQARGYGWRVETPGGAGWERVSASLVKDLAARGWVAVAGEGTYPVIYMLTDAGRAALEQE